MKIPILILCLMLPLFFTARAADDSSLLLQKALFEEEANHDLAAAVKAYESVIADADAQRKLAATAVFRLGECFRKLGRTNDAVAQYQRVLEQFGDQTNLVSLSQQNLATLRPASALAVRMFPVSPARMEAHRLLIERLQLEVKTSEAELTRFKALVQEKLISDGDPRVSAAEAQLLDARRKLILAHDEDPAGTADGVGASGPALPGFSPAARAQLRDLLQGEIKVAEQLLAEQRKRVNVGTLAPGDEVRFERDVVNLKRQLLAADDLATPEARKQYRDLLQQAIDLAEKAVQVERKKLESGKSIPSEVAQLQRDVFALKRELVAFDATPLANAFSGGPRESAAATDEEEKEVRRIQALIKDSPDLVNARNVQVGTYSDAIKYGTPLHKAAQQGQLVVARFLLDNQADIELRDTFGRTPLHWAAINGHKSMAELLLSRGADVNATIQSDRWVPSSGNTALHLAADAGYRTVCETLLAGKANPNARGQNGETATHMAARKNFRSIVELLLAKGADVNAREAGQATPLHAAAETGAKATVELLLANKGDVNAQANLGGTPLYSAVNGNRDEVVRVLLGNKANPNLALNEKGQNQAGWTPLVAAVSQEDVPTARLLLENGADPNAVWNRNGWTVLMQAASKGHVELVEALIAAGADVNAKDNGDTRATALYYAANGNPTNAPAIVELLLKNKADANVKDSYGSTPLIQAVSRRNPEVVKLLVENGADVNAMTRQGESPLSLIKPQRQQGLGGIGYAAPAPGIPGAIPSRAVRQIGVGGQPAQPPPDPTPEIIALLEQRGARDDLRRLSAISTSRNQEDRRGWFYKGTNDWNQFTLLELIAWVNPRRDPNPGVTPYLAFPDLTRIAISRIDPKTAKTQDIRLDLATALANGDCAKDAPLQWGDVVEIPEQDHFVNATWDRFPDDYYKTFQKCLERTVRVTVKGQPTNVVLTPFRFSTRLSPGPNFNPWEPRMTYFRLNGFLRDSGLLLSSSDVTRVKVKRRDPVTKQARERVFNLDEIQQQGQRGDSSNDLWLRDGDEIEVPEKDANRAAATPRPASEDASQSISLQVTDPVFLEPVNLQFQSVPLVPGE